MSDDFLENLTSLTDNLNDIAFTRFVTITNVNSDGTIDCQEDNGTVHKNVKNSTFFKPSVEDLIILGFADNDIYEPFVLGCIDVKRDVYTKDEVDDIVEDIISGDIDLTRYVKKVDVDLEVELEGPNPEFDSNGGYMTIGIDVGDGF